MRLYRQVPPQARVRLLEVVRVTDRAPRAGREAASPHITFGPTPTLTLLGGLVYSSATTFNDFPSGAWFVIFDRGGGRNVGNKHDAFYVRAVRTVL